MEAGENKSKNNIFDKNVELMQIQFGAMVSYANVLRLRLINANVNPNDLLIRAGIIKKPENYVFNDEEKESDEK